jgi:hypothetical protein
MAMLSITISIDTWERRQALARKEKTEVLRIRYQMETDLISVFRNKSVENFSEIDCYNLICD